MAVEARSVLRFLQMEKCGRYLCEAGGEVDEGSEHEGWRLDGCRSYFVWP